MKKTVMMIAAMMAMAAMAVDTSIAYQGILKTGDGLSAISGSRQITFSLYGQASGGTAFWTKPVNVTLDNTGLFNVELEGDDSNGISLAAALASGRGGALYIGLTVKDSSGEISPRQKILMTPYASWAADVTQAQGDFTVAGKARLKDVEVSGALNVNGTTTFSQPATFSQGVTVSGSINVGNTGSISGFGTIPVGGIIMWSGSKVPDGWALCNGQSVNGITTPDLRGRFVVASGQNGGEDYPIGKTGGEEKHKLTVDEMPSHHHGLTFWGVDIAEDWKRQNNLYGTHNKYDYNNWRDTNDVGGDKAHENRPPFYALAFIMRVR